MSGAEWQTIEALQGVARGLHAISGAISLFAIVFAWYAWRRT